jgi:hypothetical protein
MSAQQTEVTDALAAFPGLLGGYGKRDMHSYLNEEADGEVPFGFVVCQGSDPNTAILPTSQADVSHDGMLGIVAHSHAYAKDNELGDMGLKEGVTLNVLRSGSIWVYVNEAVTMGADVRVMASDTLSPEGELDGPGSFWSTTANGGDTVLITNGARWMTETTGAGLALLQFDCDAMTFSND